MTERVIMWVITIVTSTVSFEQFISWLMINKLYTTKKVSPDMLIYRATYLAFSVKTASQLLWEIPQAISEDATFYYLERDANSVSVVVNRTEDNFFGRLWYLHTVYAKYKAG